MTITLDDGPMTLRTMLLPSGDAAFEQRLGEGLTATMTSIDWGAVGEATETVVRRDFTDAVGSLLEVSLGDVLVAGWRKHGELKAAAARTLLPPGAPETVTLASHRISHQASPYVEVSVSGVEAGRVPFTLTVVVDVTVLSGRVSDGRLVALHAGDATVTATLALSSVHIAQSQPHTLHLPLDLALGDGIRLVAPHPPGVTGGPASELLG